MIRRIITIQTVLALVLLIPAAGFGQTGILQETDTIGEATADQKSGNHSVYTGVGFGNNMIYLGSTISGDKPFGYAALSYGFRNKIYLSLSAVHITDLDPFAAFYTGSVSFTHVINSWFDIAAGFSRYMVPAALTDTLFNSFNYADLTFGIDWRILYTKLYAGRLMAGENGSYFQVRNSRYFETPEFSRKKATVSFDPYVNVLFGSITKAETTTGTTTILLPPFWKGRTKTIVTTSTEYFSEFGLMELDLGIPVSLNLSKMTLEIEPGYIHPLYSDSVYPGARGFFFLASLYFKIL